MLSVYVLWIATFDSAWPTKFSCSNFLDTKKMRWNCWPLHRLAVCNCPGGFSGEFLFSGYFNIVRHTHDTRTSKHTQTRTHTQYTHTSTLVERTLRRGWSSLANFTSTSNCTTLNASSSSMWSLHTRFLVLFFFELTTGIHRVRDR